MQSYNPNFAETKLVWALSTSLAATTEIIIIFSSSRYLDVSVPWVCPHSGNKSSTYWVSPFGNLRINGLLAPPRSLSQLSTSFIASKSLGIHHAPFVTFLQFLFEFIVVLFSVIEI